MRWSPHGRTQTDQEGEEDFNLWFLVQCWELYVPFYTKKSLAMADNGLENFYEVQLGSLHDTGFAVSSIKYSLDFIYDISRWCTSLYLLNRLIKTLVTSGMNPELGYPNTGNDRHSRFLLLWIKPQRLLLMVDREAGGFCKCRYYFSLVYLVHGIYSMPSIVFRGTHRFIYLPFNRWIKLLWSFYISRN